MASRGGKDIELPNQSGTVDARLDTPLQRQIRENVQVRKSLPTKAPAPAKKPSPLRTAIRGYKQIIGRR